MTYQGREEGKNKELVSGVESFGGDGRRNFQGSRGKGRRQRVPPEGKAGRRRADGSGGKTLFHTKDQRVGGEKMSWGLKKGGSVAEGRKVKAFKRRVPRPLT